MTLMPHYIIFKVFDILIVEKLESSPGKKGWESLPLACDNTEEASSLEGQRRERELGKCQK